MVTVDNFGTHVQRDPQSTTTLVVTSQESNAWSVFASQANLRATCVRVRLRPRDQLNAQDADTTTVLVNRGLYSSHNLFK